MRRRDEEKEEEDLCHKPLEVQPLPLHSVDYYTEDHHNYWWHKPYVVAE
jgi:hypothetical protein